MKKVRNIAVIVLSVICVGILAFLLWNLGSTEESAQEIIPEVQPESMSEQSVSDSDVSGNSAENSGDPTELPETEESEPVDSVASFRQVCFSDKESFVERIWITSGVTLFFPNVFNA